tara:strand:+ start:457 stop:963 length:507 start_codon:yes stop_codon:yes gene_type:complete
MDEQEQKEYFKNRNKDKLREEKVKEYMDYYSLRYVRYGLDALDTDYPIGLLQSFIRRAPDFIAFKKNNRSCFIEAKGFKGEVKIKIEDLEAYIEWDRRLAVLIVIHDEISDTYSTNTLKDIHAIMLEKECRKGYYPEGEEEKKRSALYYVIEKEWLAEYKKLGETNEG